MSKVKIDTPSIPRRYKEAIEANTDAIAKLPENIVVKDWDVTTSFSEDITQLIKNTVIYPSIGNSSAIFHTGEISIRSIVSPANGYLQDEVCLATYRFTYTDYRDGSAFIFNTLPTHTQLAGVLSNVSLSSTGTNVTAHFATTLTDDTEVRVSMHYDGGTPIYQTL